MVIKASRKNIYFHIILVIFSLATILFWAPAAKVKATSNTILINEVMYDPEGTDLGYEWIELKNISNSTIDLEGWKIQAAGAQFTDVLTISSLSIQPNQILLIGEQKVQSDYPVSKLAFQNGGSESDGIRLVDNAGMIVDTVIYDSPNSNNLIDDTGYIGISFADDVPSGYSLCRIGINDTDNSANDFTQCKNSTPGNDNLFPPIIIFEYDTPIYIGRETKFDATESSDIDGNIVSYEWKINNTKVGTNSNTLTFSFPEVGTYNVSLSGTDNSGLTTSSEETINIIEDPDNPQTIPISKFKNLEIGQRSSIKGAITAEPGQLYKSEGYIQDDTGGIRFKLDSTKVQRGKSYILTGKLGTTYGEKRVLVEKIIPVESNAIIQPLETTNLTSNIGTLIKIVGTVTKKNGSYLFINIGEEEVRAYFSKYLDLEIPSDIKDKEISIIGIVSQYGNDELGTPKVRVMPVISTNVEIEGQVLATTGQPILIYYILSPIAIFYTLLRRKYLHF
ncbi:MAG: lamin tail domain-containing protein [bacterium]